MNFSNDMWPEFRVKRPFRGVNSQDVREAVIAYNNELIIAIVALFIVNCLLVITTPIGLSNVVLAKKALVHVIVGLALLGAGTYVILMRPEDDPIKKAVREFLERHGY